MLEVEGPLLDSTEGHTLEASLALQASQGNPPLSSHPRLPFPGECAVTHSGITERQRVPEMSDVWL